MRRYSKKYRNRKRRVTKKPYSYRRRKLYRIKSKIRKVRRAKAIINAGAETKSNYTAIGAP